MRLTRRRMLTFGAVAALTGTGLAALTANRGLAAYTLELIGKVFGPEFAGQPAAREFALAYESFVLEKGHAGRALDLAYRFGVDRVPGLGSRLGRIDDSIIEKFATSTNVVLAHERGAPLEFTGLFHPYESPCISQLSAQAES